MKILLSGASGLIGSAWQETASQQGHDVYRLLRSNLQKPNDILWNPSTGIDKPDLLEGFDAVIHLAGENIASGRWTDSRKQRIRDSRVIGTRILSATLAEREVPPKDMICASAVGYYGSQGDLELTEDAPPGNTFLAEVCKDWEEACDPLRRKGTRVVNLRIGVVLSSRGGALKKMMPMFKAGLGGVLGDGRMYMSWITLEDAVRVINFCINTDEIAGPVNTVAPNPVTNKEFTKTLGQILKRPAWLPAPAFALKLALGEMAEELLLSSIRAVPEKLKNNGFAFRHLNLSDGLSASIK